MHACKVWCVCEHLLQQSGMNGGLNGCRSGIYDDASAANSSQCLHVPHRPRRLPRWDHDGCSFWLSFNDILITFSCQCVSVIVPRAFKVKERSESPSLWALLNNQLGCVSGEIDYRKLFNAGDFRDSLHYIVIYKILFYQFERSSHKVWISGALYSE